MENQDRMMTLEQVGRRMSMDTSTILRKIQTGELHAIDTNGEYHIAHSEFRRFKLEVLNRMTEAAIPDIEAELFGNQIDEEALEQAAIAAGPEIETSSHGGDVTRRNVSMIALLASVFKKNARQPVFRASVRMVSSSCAVM